MDSTDQYRDIEAALRGELAVRAGSISDGAGGGLGEAPYPAVARAARRDRRRRRAGAATGVILVTALTVAIPYGADSLFGTPTGSIAVGGGPSPLLASPLRGNLAGDSAFIAAAQSKLDNEIARTLTLRDGPDSPGAAATSAAIAGGLKVIYANDDGTHRVVIGAAFDGQYTDFVELVGPHSAAVSALALNDGSSSQTSGDTFTFLGIFSGGGGPIPFVVLGPTTMTDVEYSTTPKLEVRGGKIVRVRSNVQQASTVDGAAAGEITDASTVIGASGLGAFTVFRAELGGGLVNVDPGGRNIVARPDSSVNSTAKVAIRAEIAQQGTNAGLDLNPDSVSGDAVPDNVAEILADLAGFADVPLTSVGYHVDWIGQESTQWDSALLDVTAPGLPKMQIFVRGQATGTPGSASPGLVGSLIRPAVTLTSGHLPTTAAAFGGVPESSVVGYGLANEW